MYNHVPVLIKEAIDYLDPQPGDLIVDCTLGGGGYTMEIAKRVGKTGRVIAIDLDESAIKYAKLKSVQERLENISLYHASCREREKMIKEDFSHTPYGSVAGLVFDLGLSSGQLEDSTRGFSFQTDDPLNMAFGSLISARRTEEIVNNTPVSELASIIREFGEERFALPIARSIAFVRRHKPITTTGELVAAISRAVPGAYRRSRLHFATRTFQALRIATNEELASLKILLGSLKNFLQPNARIVAISFHSLEDRIVKNFFKDEARDCVCPPSIPLCVCHHKAWLKILTKKAITASSEEITANPRSRSAKLRAAITI